MELKPVVDYAQLVKLTPDVVPDRVTELSQRLSAIYVGNPDGQALAGEIFERALSPKPRNEVRGVYVLAGQRSTAKKTLVNTIAKVLFGDAEKRIMIDSRQLINPYAVLRLLDPSILNDGPQMMMPGMPRRPMAMPLLSQENLQKVRGNGVDCTIVCLDHYQAGSEYLYQTLQKIFFDGFYGLDDANKSKIDFRDVIFVLLVDTDEVGGRTGLPGLSDEDPKVESVKKSLGDAMMEHVDGIAMCRNFNRDEQTRILGMEIDAFAGYMKTRVGCDVVVDEKGRTFLLDQIDDGRGSDVVANLTKHVIRPINVEELKGNVRKGRTVYATHQGGDGLSFFVADTAADAPVDDGSSTAAVADPGTAGDGASASAGFAADDVPRAQKRFAIIPMGGFDSEDEAKGWQTKIVDLLGALPLIDKAEIRKNTLKLFNKRWMLRVEFVTSAQGFEAIVKALPDWGQGSFVMFT